MAEIDKKKYDTEVQSYSTSQCEKVTGFGKKRKHIDIEDSSIDIRKDSMDRGLPGLRVLLMPHQRQSLMWMKWREEQEPSGGILADDMGLGKTLQLISSLLFDKNKKASNNTNSKSEKTINGGWIKVNECRTFKGKTLVVCPPGLIDHWRRELKSKTENAFKVYIYHGPSRSIYESRLTDYDIVITSYHLLTQEYESHVHHKILRDTRLYNIIWERIILDEAHVIRNYKGKMNNATCEITARSRWALTGTPIQNNESDLYALLKFLHSSCPLDKKPVWIKSICNYASIDSRRFDVINNLLILRRTKDELIKKGMMKSLPDKKVQIIQLDLDPDEKIVYEKLLFYSQTFLQEYLNQLKNNQIINHQKNKQHFILVLLLRLRQICCQPSLIECMLDKEDVELVYGNNKTTIVSATVIDKVQKVFAEEDEVDEQNTSLNINDNIVKNVMSKTNPVFRQDRKSSKIRAIIKIVQEIVDLQEKIVIVSQWTSYLNIIAHFLENIEGAYYSRFTGQVPVKDRQNVVDKLNDEQNKMNILLLSLTCGGVGLNLVGANNLLIVDLHWNPHIEAQAQDRIYRFGQDKNVKIWKFVCTNTIEEKIKQLQDRKLKLSENILNNTVSNELTIDDLKLLFA